MGGTGGGAWYTFAIWRSRHRFSTSVRATGSDDTSAGHAFVIWRDRDRLPTGVSVCIDMCYSASAVLRKHSIFETRLVETCSNDEIIRS